MFDPTADDASERSLLGLELTRAREPNTCPVWCEPLQKAFWVFDGYAAWTEFLDLCTQVEDEADSILLSEIHGRKVLVRAEAWRLPLDSFENAWTGSQDCSAYGFNFGLVRMNKLRHECVNGCRGVSGSTAVSYTHLMTSVGVVPGAIAAFLLGNGSDLVVGDRLWDVFLRP